jgi:hypothetical protein
VLYKSELPQTEYATLDEAALMAEMPLMRKTGLKVPAVKLGS